MKKRKPKLGSVYLLKSRSTEGIYKYGCTTLSAEDRCKGVNRQKNCGGYDFYVLAEVASNDCYKAETNVKWNLLDDSVSAISEVISIEFFSGSENELIERFIALAGFRA